MINVIWVNLPFKTSCGCYRKLPKDGGSLSDMRGYSDMYVISEVLFKNWRLWCVGKNVTGTMGNIVRSRQNTVCTFSAVCRCLHLFHRQKTKDACVDEHSRRRCAPCIQLKAKAKKIKNKIRLTSQTIVLNFVFFKEIYIFFN